MTVEQVYNLVNDITSEMLGDSGILNEDLSNVVEVGRALDPSDYDNYCAKLTDRIGRTVIVNDRHKFKGFLASLMMQSWEFGSCLQKIRIELPQATENETWSLVDGASYDPNVFHKPEVSVDYYNKKITFDVEMSFTRKQIQESFISAEMLNAFVSGIYTAIENAMVLEISGLAQRALNNMIGLTVYDEYQSTSGFNLASHVKAVNLLYEYNDIFSASLQPEDTLTSKEFLRYASYRMSLYADRMTKPTRIYNMGKKANCTPRDRLNFVLLSEFYSACKSYLYSDTFNDEFVRLPEAETVPYWAGSGTDYDFDDTSKIDVVTTDNKSMTITGIIGVMFDREAVAVCNRDKYVTTNFNAKGNFVNEFYHYDCELLNDRNENFVVFMVA